MKKILFLTAVTILAAVSCNKIDDEGATTFEPVFEPSNVPSFVASVDGAPTKTVIGVEGEGENAVTKSYWNGTESIRVFDGKLANGKVYTATVEEKVESAEFVEENTQSSLTGTAYFAAYPATPAGSVTWDGKIANPAKNFWLPAEQTPTKDSYDPATHIAVAYTTSENLSLEFKNVVSLVKLEIPYNNITEVYFYGNSGEIIAGNFDVKYNDGDPIVVHNDNYTHYTDVHIKKNFTQGEVYYLSMLPTTFKKGFTIEFVMDGVKYIKKINSEFTVKRSEIIALPKVEFEKFTPASGCLYLKPNDDWKSNDARFAAYFYDAAGVSKWVDMTHVANTYLYKCTVPTDKDYLGVVLCRMNPSSKTNGWTQDTQLWNKTGDQLLCIGNQFEITGWEAGKWSGTAIYTDYLFLKPNSNWTQSNARFAAYFFGNGETWVNMKDVNLDGYYEVRRPTAKNYPNVIFGRMNPATSANNFNDGVKWNQTGDLTIPTNGNNLYTVKEGTWDKGGGTWSKK
ncbi:MAG: hypothetical protein IKZ08_05250 [Bacteroidales bacterium]|nr:hypothetical protein [Bacteroidales bacterium]MBR5862718.1 hypothetical protein [Bacteroidales bacterium]